MDFFFPIKHIQNMHYLYFFLKLHYCLSLCSKICFCFFSDLYIDLVFFLCWVCVLIPYIFQHISMFLNVTKNYLYSFDTKWAQVITITISASCTSSSIFDNIYMSMCMSPHLFNICWHRDYAQTPAPPSFMHLSYRLFEISKRNLKTEIP